MTTDERPSTTSPDGFLTVDALRARATGAASAEAFAKACPGPALLVLEDSEKGPGMADVTPSRAFALATLEGAASKGAAAARGYAGRAVFLAKRAGNPFPNMISLGRSTSNDVVIALETISKLHGYFLRESEGWFYTDYQSTNGTLVNGKKVEKGERRLLADGDRFRLGLDVNALFLVPSTLYERVRGG
jgi:hypothetical protein